MIVNLIFYVFLHQSCQIHFTNVLSGSVRFQFSFSRMLFKPVYFLSSFFVFIFNQINGLTLVNTLREFLFELIEVFESSQWMRLVILKEVFIVILIFLQSDILSVFLVKDILQSYHNFVAYKHYILNLLNGVRKCFFRSFSVFIEQFLEIYCCFSSMQHGNINFLRDISFIHTLREVQTLTIILTITK